MTIGNLVLSPNKTLNIVYDCGCEVKNDIFTHLLWGETFVYVNSDFKYTVLSPRPRLGWLILLSFLPLTLGCLSRFNHSCWCNSYYTLLFPIVPVRESRLSLVRSLPVGVARPRLFSWLSFLPLLECPLLLRVVAWLLSRQELLHLRLWLRPTRLWLTTIHSLQKVVQIFITSTRLLLFITLAHRFFARILQSFIQRVYQGFHLA